MHRTKVQTWTGKETVHPLGHPISSLVPLPLPVLTSRRRGRELVSVTSPPVPLE